MIERHHFSGAASLAALLLAALIGVACGEPRASETSRLVVTGSSTIAPLLLEIGRRFESGPGGDARVDVQTGGSSRGIADVRTGLADIGMVSRALLPPESDLAGHVIARDGVALIVHASNPVTMLSDDQIRAVYTGRIANWNELGGADGPITVVHKAAGRSTHEVFVAHMELEDREIRASIVIGDNQHGIKSVSGNPAAIGYVSIGSAEQAVDIGRPIRLLPLAGVPATSAHVANGSFPLLRELNLVTSGQPTGLAATFIDYAMSPAVGDLVEAHSFVAAR
jgi:phosphate transport system substrate-binding protein